MLTVELVQRHHLIPQEHLTTGTQRRMEREHRGHLVRHLSKLRNWRYTRSGKLPHLSTCQPQQEQDTSLLGGAHRRQRLPESPGVTRRREVLSCLQSGRRTALSIYIKVQTGSSIHILFGFTPEMAAARIQTAGIMPCRKYTVHLEEVQSSTHVGSLTPLRYWLYPLR